MKLEDSNVEDLDINEEYEMVPLEPMMYGYGQMNMMQNMGMPVGYMQDGNPNIGMNSLMGINPWMRMNQFNDGTYMNSFNPVARMYGDESMDDYEEENEGLDQMDKYQDTERFREQFTQPGRPNPQYNEVNSIVRRIERYNPAIIRRLNRCGIPYAEAREIVTRIVRVALMYRDE